MSVWRKFWDWFCTPSPPYPQWISAGGHLKWVVLAETPHAVQIVKCWEEMEVHSGARRWRWGYSTSPVWIPMDKLTGEELIRTNQVSQEPYPGGFKGPSL